LGDEILRVLPIFWCLGATFGRGLNNAGLVIGLEVFRLARNSSDWHRLLEICALTGTLILDEDGLYDPAHFNDRLLLGLNRPEHKAPLIQPSVRPPAPEPSCILEPERCSLLSSPSLRQIYPTC
jgi:hypothetical protein